MTQVITLTTTVQDLHASLSKKDSEIEAKETIIARLNKDITILTTEKQQLETSLVIL
jgi:hypothetical protein